MYTVIQHMGNGPSIAHTDQVGFTWDVLFKGETEKEARDFIDKLRYIAIYETAKGEHIPKIVDYYPDNPFYQGSQENCEKIMKVWEKEKTPDTYAPHWFWDNVKRIVNE